MTILKIMCGCPGVGKSHYVKTHAKPEDLVVSRDEIRNSIIKPGMAYFSRESQVFEQFCEKINEGLYKYNIIWVDATHLNNTSRWKLLYGINRDAFEEIDFIALEAPLDTCLTRNLNRNGLARIPSSSIRRMYETYKRPSYNDFLSLKNVKIEVINNGNDF